MLLLKATEINWGLTGPGDWEKRTWKVNTDGTFTRKTKYRPVDPEDASPGETEEGALYEEQMESLQESLDEYWSPETTQACDGTAWEFKLYDEHGTVVRHREPGYIYGIEPFRSIAALLTAEEPDG